MRDVAATVLLPTTGDRGPLLAISAGSVLVQSVADLELLIIGDGIDRSTREAAMSLCERDPRVRLFDFPKHARRGEPHRHDVLTAEARGRIVGYICDRDLWLPDHLAELGRLLDDHDFAHTLRFRVGSNDDYWFLYNTDLRDPVVRGRAARSASRLVPLSIAGHTLASYRQLPYGWRTTPDDLPTDTYMWMQFLEQSWVRVAASALPTVLTFKRGDHPGLSTPRRLEILERWSRRIAGQSAAEAVQRDIIDALWKEWSRLDAADRRRLSQRLRHAAARTKQRRSVR